MSEYEQFVKQYMGPARTKKLLKFKKQDSKSSIRSPEKSQPQKKPTAHSPQLPHVATVQKLSQSISDDKLSSQKSSALLQTKTNASKIRPPNFFDSLRARVDMNLLVPKKKDIQEYLNQDDVRARKIQTAQEKVFSLLEINDLEGALTQLGRILFFDQNIAQVYVQRAEVYLQLCDISSAIANYKQAVKIKNIKEWSDKLNQLYFLKGLTLIEEGYCNDALNLIKTVQSQDVRFTYLRALSYIRGGDKGLAFQEIDRCLEQDPTNIQAIILKGKLLWSVDREEDGNEQFWIAHNIDPDHNEVVEFRNIMRPKAEQYYQKAVKCIFESNEKIAMIHIRKGLECFHDLSKLLLLRASIYRKNKQFIDAIQDLEKASKFMHDEGIEGEVKAQIGLTYNDMGMQYFARQMFQNAITLFNESLKFIPSDPGVYTNRGDSYRELGKFNLALADYHYALDNNGQKIKINGRLALSHNAIGVNCYNSQDYEGAALEFSRAIDYLPNSADFYVNRAKCSMALKKIDATYKDLKEAIKHDPNHYTANTLLQNFRKPERVYVWKGKIIREAVEE